jgi:hypothetical protein
MDLAIFGFIPASCYLHVIYLYYYSYMRSYPMTALALTDVVGCFQMLLSR